MPHKTSAIACLLLLALTAAAGCDQDLIGAEDSTPPTLTLRQSGLRTVDLQIAGSISLRALQAFLVYDAVALRLAKVEAGEDTKRLDRVFFGDINKANGRVVVGVSDTRQVHLPARGTLFRYHFEPTGAPNPSTIKVDSPLGAVEGGKAVTLSPAQLTVTIK